MHILVYVYLRMCIMPLVSVSGGKSSQFTNKASSSGDLYGDEGKCNNIIVCS